MLRLKAGGQAIRHRPRPVTVCLGHDVDWPSPVSEVPLGAQERGIRRRRDSYTHELSRDDGSTTTSSTFPSYPAGIYLIGTQMIQNFQLLHVNWKRKPEVSVEQIYIYVYIFPPT